MGVRFIIGRAGSGKSLHCFSSIVEMMRADPLGPPIYLIVNKQETFTAERELTCLSGLNGFCRTRVVSFELLGEQVLADCGGSAIPRVTELGRQMIIGHLLRQHESELRYFRSAARRIGLAAALDATFAEIEHCGRTPLELANLISSLKHDGDDPSLLEKLSDLRLLYDRYLAYLGQDRLDPHCRLEQVLAAMDRSKSLKSAIVFVDGFLEIYEWQRRMLTGLAQVCREVRITLLMDPADPIIADPHQIPDELGLFHKTESTYRHLWFTFSQAGVEPDPPLLLKKISRFANPSLGQIERHLFASRRVVCQQVENIELIEAADRRAEVDATARHIRGLLADGLRLREILVLMRNVDDYYDLIDASFREHDIPFFADRRRTAAHHSLLQFTRSALQIALNGWPHDAVMSLLKSQLAGLDPDQADELENYVLLHRIRGEKAWMDEKPWAFARKLTRGKEDESDEPEQADLEHLDRLRRELVGRIAPLVNLFAGGQPRYVREIVLELAGTFERFGVRATISSWIEQSNDEGNLADAGEHEQVWAELMALLDQMVDVIGEQEVNPGDFVNILEAGLERFDLALVPPTADQVLAGAVDRTRNVEPKALILLGMNDGQFPLLPREDSILCDTERQTLRQHRLELDPDTQRNLLDERLLGYLALTRASHHLCLIRAVADEQNRPLSASPFWMGLLVQFPSLKPVQLARQTASPGQIGTPRQLLSGLMDWVRHPTDDEAWPSLYHWLADSSSTDPAIGPMCQRAWPSLGYQNDARLSDALAGKLFSSPLRASVSQIETFAACPFQHFARYGLKLKTRDEEDVTAIDLGIACHRILEQIVKRMLENNLDWSGIAQQSNPEQISQLAQEVGKQIRGELLISNGRNQYILRHIEKTIAQVLEAQSATGARGKFIPWRTELPFGDQTNLGPLVLQTPNGRELRLQGKIDRVDLVRDRAAFAVIDYKYHGGRLAVQNIVHGLSLQLLTYLLVLQVNGSKLAKQKLTPAAAFYVQLLHQLQSVRHPEQDPPQEIKPRGMIDMTHCSLLDVELDEDARGVGPLYSRPDGRSGDEFAALLKLAEQKLAELGDQIITGTIDVAPYRMNETSPCVQCEYRSVCRFDPVVNRYRKLPAVRSEDIVKKLKENGS